MYSKAQLALKFINYYLRAGNGRGHGIHSPFVFDFITKLLNDRQLYPEYSIAEQLRTGMKSDKRQVQVEDFGAGSALSKTNQRRISSIAQHAAKPPKLGQLLFRTVKKYQPQTIVELGTSLGITTTYLSLAKPDAKLITLEGAGEIANIAAQNFESLGLKNVELIKGNFDISLPSVLDKLEKIDFAFIDGNHRQQPTENYFNLMLKKIHPGSILIFDDIHWSAEMEAAWLTIKSHPSVKCSIDLFFLGFVFFRTEFKERQEFVIRF